MGLGTGVLRAYYAVCFMRGLTVGVASTSSLFIARRTGAPQNFLVAARGVGLTLGPALLGRGIGRMVWSGEAQSGFAVALAAKMLCELLIPRIGSPPLLYAAFFVVGLMIASVDTSANVLVTRVYGKSCGLPLMLYCAAYGIGSVLAPWLVILFSEHAWDVLALVDFSVASLLAYNRLGRGKPRNWKAKIRGLAAPAPAAAVATHTAHNGNGTTNGKNGNGVATKADAEAQPGAAPEVAKVGAAPAMQGPVPRRVLRAGMAFMYIAEAAETSVSCWTFTFGVTELGLSAKVAAMLPSAFYFSFTATRLVVVPVSSRLLPSTIAQVGTLVTLIGAILFYCLVGAFFAAIEAGAGADELAGKVKLLIACLALMGAGTCPLFAMIIASLRQHGEMNARDQGMYDACVNLGMTTGMWLPGMVSLPKVELWGAVCIFLIINSHVRDFPWWRSSGQGAAARELP